MGRRSPEVLLIDAAPERSAQVAALLERRGIVIHRQDLASRREFGRAQVAVMVLEAAPSDIAAVSEAIRELTEKRMATLVWGGAPQGRGFRQCLYAPPTASADEVVGQLAAACAYAPMLSQMERELNRLDRCARQVARHVEQVDNEMRLAGRLQHDFLPKKFPVAPPLRFAQLYRPATWVSGDMLDVFRVDDEHVALFIADAMGHGTAAALMTMFMRKAVIPTREGPEGRELILPAEVIAEMNTSMTQLNFSSTQLMTAAYGLINTRTLELRVARGGHPYPIIARRDGRIEELQPVGALLGIADMPDDFEEAATTLAPGDLVVLYTDGIEDLIIRDRDDSVDPPKTTFSEELLTWLRGDAESFIRSVSDYLDHREGSLTPEDDMSIIAIDVQE